MGPRCQPSAIANTLPLASNTLNSRGFPGDGYIDFPTITQWVVDAGYTGDIEVEIFNSDIWALPVAETVRTMGERYSNLVLPAVQPPV